VAALKAAAERGERHPRELKAELGRRIVSDFHSDAAAVEASNEFDRMFRERQTPTDIPAINLTLPGPGGSIKLVKLLAEQGLVSSVSEAQRAIAQGSVRLNGERVSDVKCEIASTAGEVLVQVGKRKFLRVTLKEELK
jgi:tyrosyl-tRNA synthetase